MNTRYNDYGYSRPGHASGAAGIALAEKYVDIVAALPGVSTVADLGCGNGYLASELGKAGYRVTGIDASPSGIEIARQHYATERVDFVCSDFDSPDTVASPAPASCDVVVSSDVIEHLYRPAVLVETAARLLRPGGLLVVGTPYHGYLKDLALAVAGKWDAHHNPNWDGGHIKFFSVRSLRTLVESQGFREARFHFQGRAPWLWKNMICVASKP